MNKLTLLIAVPVLVLGALTPAAEADTASVAGSGPISKMVVQNDGDQIVVKVSGPGKGSIRWVQVDLRDKQGDSYRAMGGVYGVDFVPSLSKGQKLLSCGGFKLTYRSGAWKFVVPRSCVGKLAGTVKAQAELASTASALPGEAGPTGWVARG